MKTVHWIEAELSRHFDELDLGRGADLDRDGEIAGSERTDRNGDGNVDAAEWQKFVGNNKAALEILGGHFKTYYTAGTAFKPDNPIHDLLAIESEVASQDDVKRAYARVTEIFDTVKERLAIYDIGPKVKLALIYEMMEEVGFKWEDNHHDNSFVNSMNRKSLDCHTSSFIVLSVTHELGWPVYLVHLPTHAFVRWDDGKRRKFNMDQGVIFSDLYYLYNFNIPETAVYGVYMINMEYSDVLAAFYAHRGTDKQLDGAYMEEDISNASCTHIRYVCGKYEEAIKDFDKAIELNPKSSYSYLQSALIKNRMGRPEEARKDYEKANELDPNTTTLQLLSESIYKVEGGSGVVFGKGCIKGIRNCDKTNDLNASKKLKPANEKIDSAQDDEIESSSRCLCKTPGSRTSSNHSLLSLLIMLFD